MNTVTIDNEKLYLKLTIKESGLLWSEDIMPQMLDALRALGYVISYEDLE